MAFEKGFLRYEGIYSGWLAQGSGFIVHSWLHDPHTALCSSCSNNER
jgi:hypothetical protein